MVEWRRQRIHRSYQVGEGHEAEHGSLSDTLLHLIREEPLRTQTILDVGCGSGRLTFALANETSRIIGIDWSDQAIERAQQHARTLGLDHVTFQCCDAERIYYRELGPIDLVVANLCMSDEILRRAGVVLQPGRFIAFAAFHRDQWKESGKISQFAYQEGQIETALTAVGFEPVYLGLEQEVLHFAGQDEALSYLESAGMSEKWRADSRWRGFLAYLEGGGRELTIRAHVIVKARKR